MDINGTAGLRSGAPVINVETGRSAAPQPATNAAPVVADNGINVPSTKAIPVLPPAESEVKRSIEVINQFLKRSANDIEFSIDQDSGKTLVKIIDTATHTVLRQFPSEQAVEIARDLDKLQGLLVRDKA